MVMVAPGALGACLDKQAGTNFLAAIGFVFGMILAIGLLMLFARIKTIDNDGEIMKPRSSSSTSSSQSLPHLSSSKPSESKLPEVPGAEVLEPPRDD